MSAAGTPKASEAAVATVQDALGQMNLVGPMRHIFQDDEMADALEVLLAQEIEVVARAAADAAAPHIAAQTLRDAGAEFATRTQEAAGAVREHWRGQDFVDGQDTAYENAAEWCDAEADRIEAGQ